MSIYAYTVREYGSRAAARDAAAVNLRYLRGRGLRATMSASARGYIVTTSMAKRAARRRRGFLGWFR